MLVAFFKEHFMQSKSIAMAVLAACMTCDVMALYIFENDWSSTSEGRAQRFCEAPGWCDCGSVSPGASGRDFAKLLAAIGPANGLLQFFAYLNR
jgi:hypothetical protein